MKEHIELADPICIQIRCADEIIGYALLDDKDERGILLIEFYLVLEHRNNAKQVLDILIHKYRCCRWFVNSQDSFALPLMLENGFAYELDCLIFSVDPYKYPNGKQEDTYDIEMAKPEELQPVFCLVMQDKFYTGDGQEALGTRIHNGEIYLFRSQEAIIGVGFISPIVRTPRYADIAMIIDKPQRRKGFASKLVNQFGTDLFYQRIDSYGVNIHNQYCLQKERSRSAGFIWMDA